MSNRRRVALVGAGHRGTGMWGKDLAAGWGDAVEMVAVCDSNAVRARHAQAAIGGEVSIHADFDEMLRTAKPHTVIVCTPDATHDRFIIAALRAGVDVVTEKPITTTLPKLKAILAAEAETGRRIDVAFNYRHAPTARRLKSLLMSGEIGEVMSVDFHWYLDTSHGADYFRRWHAFQANSGSLFIHKATHHFDLLHWYLGSRPAEVFARGALRRYGRNGPFRGPRCKICPHKAECPFFLDIGADPWLDALYEEASHEDGYLRDACVFREEIDIYDTMSAALLFGNGVQVSYSLNAHMPIEGYHIAFNGTQGRIELRQYEKQAWAEPPADAIQVIHAFGQRRVEWVQHRAGGHFGGDDELRSLIFRGEGDDALGRRAGAEAGAVSMLTGLACLESAQSGAPVSVRALLDEALPKA